MNLSTREATRYLQGIMAGHKAMGLLAQLEFRKWVQSHMGSAAQKHFEGCWILAPKQSPYSRRTCFFVHPTIIRNDEMRGTIAGLVGDKGFQGLCSALTSGGFGIVYYLAMSQSDPPSTNRLSWTGHYYINEGLRLLDEGQFYGRWGGRGRSSAGKRWDELTQKRMAGLTPEEATSLFLPQAFYNSVLKEKFRLTIADPYDVDGFILSYGGRPFPIEIKEKFPFGGDEPKLGVDAGRVLMLLRICLPIDANSFYVVREVDNSEQRRFVGWRYVTMDQILMKCSWNLQSGGPPMASSASAGGSATSTIILPYGAFSEVTPSTFSDENLNMLSRLTQKVKEHATLFLKEMNERLGESSQKPRLD